MIQKQKGLTAISWIVIVAFLATQAVIALRIIPVYMTFGTVKSIMDDMQNDADVRGKSPKEIRKLLNRRLHVNNASEVGSKKDAFKFKKTGSGYILTCNYEQRGPIFGNLEFVATFAHEVEI